MTQLTGADQALPVGWRTRMRERILHTDTLADQQAKAAMSLLMLCEGPEITITQGVAQAVFGVTAAEWGTLLATLEGAGLMQIERSSDVRVWLRWMS